MQEPESDNAAPPPHPIRVAMLGAFPPQAQGIQGYCGELAQALGARCRVHAIGFRRMYPSFLFPGVSESMDASRAPLDAPYLRVEHRLTWYNPFGWFTAAMRARGDVFHAQWWSLPLWLIYLRMVLLMKIRRIPVVITVHNVLPHESGRGYVWASRQLCRLADRVLVHSETNRAQLIEHYRIRAERVSTIPMGTGAAQAPAAPEARRALGLPAGRRYVLCFGIIRPYKGVDTLLRAFARVAQRHDDVDLIIAGKPWTPWQPYQARIDADNLGPRVHTFLEYIPEERVPLFFGAADLVALPYTHFDAQSAVGSVALPYRKPLLVSDVGGLPDWVNGDPEWIVPPNAPDALADRMAGFFAEGDAACARFQPVADAVLARASWRAVAEAHLRIYHEVLSA